MNIYSFFIFAFLMKRTSGLRSFGTSLGRSAFSGTGRSGTGPEPAVCIGDRASAFAGTVSELAMCMAVQRLLDRILPNLEWNGVCMATTFVLI